MSKRRFLVAFAPLMLAVSACETAPPNNLRPRSAFDLQCPEDQITIQKLGPDTRGVSGCGQRATYVRVCGAESQCNWAMNSSSGDRALKPNEK